MSIQQDNNMKFRSPSTMGYLTMIIALAPGIAAFTGLKQPVPKASFKSSTGSTYSPRRSTLTKVSYISETGNHGDVTIQQQHQHQQGPVWWNSIFGGEPHDASSAAADEYLEFLDKRYNRLLDNEDKKEETGFSVMKWLYQDSSAESAPESSRKEDALYVLGVANLASKKLLQKHHRLREAYHERKEEKKAKMLDFTDAEIVDETSTTTSAAVRSATSLVRQVAHKREVLVQRQMKTLRLAMAFLVRSLVTSPVKAARQLFIVGGGKKSMAVAFTAVATITILLRPILRIVAKEIGANSMRP